MTIPEEDCLHSATPDAGSQRKKLLSSAAMLLGSLLTPQLHAQTVDGAAPSTQAADSNNLQDIVVTARRTEERGQDVPVAISALSGAVLMERGIANLAEIGNAVPGVSVAPGSARGSSAPVFAIRGQLNRDPSATADPSVGIYFADLPWARANGANAALTDLQSVQVLKGPQGTLFGRNSTAGAILISPNAPVSTLEGYARVGAGDYGQFRAEAVINLPLADTLALRLVGSHEERDGYMKDVVGGQKTSDVNNDNVRALLRWSPSDTFQSTFLGSYFISQINGDGARLTRVAPAPPSAGVASVYPGLVAALNRTATLGKYEYLSSVNPQTASTLLLGVPSAFLTSQRQRQEAWTLQNTSELSLGTSDLLGDLTLKNIIGVRRVYGQQTFETVPAPFLALQSVSRQDITQFSEELQLQGDRPGLNYVAGLFYFREKGDENSDQYVIAPIFTVSDIGLKNTSYSAFAHFNADITGGLGLAAGARITRDNRYVNYRSRRQTTPGISASPSYTCFLQPELGVNDGSACDAPYDVGYTRITWDVGLNYKVAPDSLLYASVARGYRSGGFSAGAQSPGGTTPFRPETALNYEIGSKNDFKLGNMPVRLNLAAYYTDYRDIQRTINIVTLGGGNVNRTFNAAKARILGVEADMTWRPTSTLTVSAAYAYTAPKYDEFTDLYFEPTNRQNYVIDVSDSEFILISKHTLNLSGSYRVPIPEEYGSPVVSATYNYRSSFYTTSDINRADCRVPGNPNPTAVYANCYNAQGRLPAYSLIDARIDWAKVMGSNVDVALVVRNLTNKYYFPNALNALNNFGAFSVQVGPPRMFSIELRVPFGTMR